LLIFAVIALIVLAVEHNWLGNLFKQQTASVQPTQRIETVAVSDELSVHFLDVGQGDSTLIVSGEHAMLVDTADDSMGTRIQYDLQKRGITKLDYLVLTHPDSDHIGGAPVIITKFDIQNILVSPYIKDNRYYEKVTDALSYRAYLTQTPELGDTYWLGDASFTFIAPIQQYDDPNNSSLCLILTHGQNRFLFTGDAEREAERDILESGTDLQVDVYQVGHHGSDTSTTQDFLDAVAPTYAVISCEKDNPYGHPHEEILERLQNQQVEIYRTDLQGTITAHSNGEAITWTTEITETTETINQQNSIKTA
jgi:competence protein ComEC